MVFMKGLVGLILIPFGLLASLVLTGEDGFSVGSFNVDNYRLVATERRPARTEEDRLQVVRTIARAQVDVLALQEIGSMRALQTLQSDLMRLGVVYSYELLNRTPNQEIYCAVLSRFPIVAHDLNARMLFSLYGREFSVLRGLMRVEVAISDRHRIVLVNIHLKSKLAAWYADATDYRLAEAKAVRAYLDQLLRQNPDANLVLAGDLNDGPTSRTVRVLRGVGRGRLVDCRPVELQPELRSHATLDDWRQGIAWTHHYSRDDQYLRYDYLMISRALKEVWDPTTAVIYPLGGSDHRLIATAFLLAK